jgi:hypothetical protein
LRSQHKTLYAMQSSLFKGVSRLKNPSVHVVVFSDAQKQEVFKLLEPGDLILTYTAGYMSDVFIPGAFKHGITYIGSPDDREAIALSVNVLTPNQRYNTNTLAANLQQSTLSNGTQADMIEAVAEGVIFNNLEHIMDTHINRMLVLRPRLSEAERAGHETLSADDIANYHLNSEAFDFVFLVEPKPNSESDKSLLFVGAEGESHLEKLMNAEK